MKKAISLLLCAVLCLCGAGAFAQTQGNLNNGGFIEQADDRLFLAREDGIWRTDANGGNAVKIYDGRASLLQMYEGRLYFVADEYGEDEYQDIQLLSQAPMSCLPDGSDLQTLGEKKRVSYVTDYPENEGDPIRADEYVGYRGFTVYGDHIYYLANSNEGGRYSCTGIWYDENDKANEQVIEGVYENGIQLYKADLTGENAAALTGVIGNSAARFAVDADKIYLCGGYMNTVYAYNFVNYTILNLEGDVLTAYTNPVQDRENMFSEAGQFFHIPNAILADGDHVLVSLSDSEGDFVASQLHRLAPNGEIELVAIEQEYVPSIAVGDRLYYVGSESKTNSYDDSANYSDTLGIYTKDLTEDGMGVKLVALPFTDFMYGFRMCVLGDFVYYMGGTGLCYRVNIADGALGILSDSGFEPAIVNADNAE